MLRADETNINPPTHLNKALSNKVYAAHNKQELYWVLDTGATSHD